MAKTVEEYKEMEMLLSSEECAWGDNDPNDAELIFDEENSAYDSDLY